MKTRHRSRLRTPVLVGVLLLGLCVGLVAAGEGRPPVPRPPASARPPLEAAPWPWTEVGLRFQRSGRDTQYKPLGDAVLTQDGRVLFAFPTLHTVILAAADDYALTFLGAAKYGGKGEHVLGGDRIYPAPSGMITADAAQRRLYFYKEDGQVRDYLAFQTDLFLPGPDGDFLVGRKGLYYRVDNKLRPKRTYRLLGSKHPLFQVLPNWELIACHDQETRLLHWNAEGYYLGEIDLHLPANGSARVKAVSLVAGQFWMLVASGTSDAVWCVDLSGETVGYWRTPFAADGLSVTADGLLLFDRKSAAAEAYRRH